jgi:hypothetical protein
MTDATLRSAAVVGRPPAAGISRKAMSSFSTVVAPRKLKEVKRGSKLQRLLRRA